MRLGAVAHGPRDVPAVALTFDDGPGAVTADILDVLARHRARASFHVLGERIAGREEIVRRMASAGHEIGVHGWRHADHRDRRLARARGAGLTARAVRRASGVTPRVFRPPYGLTDRRLDLAVALYGLATVLWDVDPRDFEEPGAGAIRDRTLAGVRAGSIVLLHDDRPALAPTAEAVDAILRELPRRGLRTATVSELLGSSGHSAATGWRTHPAAPRNERFQGRTARSATARIPVQLAADDPEAHP